MPAIALIAVLAAAPVATCLLAVQADSAMAMAPGDDCGAPRADQAPTLCGLEMAATSGPAGIAFVPAAAVPAYADPLESASGVVARATVPTHDTGPSGQRPPAWLLHNAFLI